MKKISLIVCSLFLVLVLAGCGKNDQSNNGQSNQEVKEVSGQGSQENEDGEDGIMKRLKNALSSGKKMKCTYVVGNEEGKTEVITYVQGDKYKTEVNVGQIKTVSVFDGDAMYSWSDGQKTGTKMTMDCIDSLDIRNETEAQNAPEDSSVQDEEKFIDTLADAENLNCEDVRDVSFEIPSDINFTDQCEALKSQQKMLENLNQ